MKTKIQPSTEKQNCLLEIKILQGVLMRQNKKLVSEEDFDKWVDPKKMIGSIKDL